MTMDPEIANGMAGIASLVTSLLMVPTILSLRKIATRHDNQIDEHGKRITALETPAAPQPAKPRRRKNGRWT